MQPKSKSRITLGLSAGLLILLAAGCDSSSPTAPSMSRFTLNQASLTVGGQTLGNDARYVHGGQGADRTRFEAHLYVDGVPAPGHHVFVEVTPPGGMGMGMWGVHRFELWDDGSRGDSVPGDGIYCLDDFAGAHGFHHSGAPHGEYHFEFWGAHRDDFSESNHLRLRIHVDP